MTIRRIGLLALLASVCGCGGAAPAAQAPTTSRLPPSARADQEAIIDTWGRSLHRAIAEDGLTEVWLDEWALRALLQPEWATRASLARMHGRERLSVSAVARGAFGRASYFGVCIQNARVEPAAGPIGLKQAGWVFDRVLVAAREPGGARLAAWVEGAFVLTDQGVGALVIDRVEAPRKEHADLQLAACDLAVGLR